MSFRSEIKNFFPHLTSALFIHAKQTSKNLVDTTFNLNLSMHFRVRSRSSVTFKIKFLVGLEFSKILKGAPPP